MVFDLFTCISSTKFCISTAAFLQQNMGTFSDLSELDANIYLGPFLEVIRSEDTAGPITGVALSSVNKFLCYGLIGEYSH